MGFADSIRIDPAYSERLRRLGLDRVGAVLERTDGRVVAWSRTTDTVYIPDPTGEPGFYVKRYHYPRWKNRTRSALRGTLLGAHRGLAEFRLLRRMIRLGLPAVRPVACGARRVAGFVAACFLITEEVPGAVNLTTFASELARGRRKIEPRQRRALVRRLARQVRALHETGFQHRQLFWRNLLVRFDLLERGEFFFLDPRPVRAGRRVLPRDFWVRELAQLAVSAAPFTTRSERLRFLLDYFQVPRATDELRQQMRQIERYARRWHDHERQRICMNERFEHFHRRLREEGPSPGIDRVAGPLESWR